MGRSQRMNIERIENFRKQMVSGPVYGMFCKTPDPAVIEVLGQANFDFVILDLEHGPVAYETLANLIRAAENADTVPIVRVPAGDLAAIGKALDLGAGGVQIPQITRGEDLRAAIKAARFSPLGERGVCRFVRNAHYGQTPKEIYFKEANQALVVAQLEGQEAMQDLEELLDITGVDVFFVGPYDLSQSLGVTGQIDHPLVIEKTREIAEACGQRGVAVGNFTDTPEQARFWSRSGIRYLSHHVDIGLFAEACRSRLSRLKNP